MSKNTFRLKTFTETVNEASNISKEREKLIKKHDGIMKKAAKAVENHAKSLSGISGWVAKIHVNSSGAQINISYKNKFAADVDINKDIDWQDNNKYNWSYSGVGGVGRLEDVKGDIAKAYILQGEIMKKWDDTIKVIEDAIEPFEAIRKEFEELRGKEQGLES